jgi:hypothetical protein
VLVALLVVYIHDLRAKALLNIIAKDSQSLEGYVIKAKRSRMLRLVGRARLAKGGKQVGDWLCEFCTTKHCLNGYVNPSKACPT